MTYIDTCHEEIIAKYQYLNLSPCNLTVRSNSLPVTTHLAPRTLKLLSRANLPSDLS